LGLAWACHGTPQTETHARGKKVGAERAEAGDTVGPVAKSPAADTTAGHAGGDPGGVAGANRAGKVGRREDPPWFRPDIVEGAKMSKRSRSVQGQSMMLLDFEAGTSVEDCIGKLTEKLAPHVALSSAPGTGKPGQLAVSGTTDEYRVTVVCGEAEGTMRAYVGYDRLK
jgi:hypothetical protein